MFIIVKRDVKTLEVKNIETTEYKEDKMNEKTLEVNKVTLQRILNYSNKLQNTFTSIFYFELFEEQYNCIKEVVNNNFNYIGKQGNIYKILPSKIGELHNINENYLIHYVKGDMTKEEYLKMTDNNLPKEVLLSNIKQFLNKCIDYLKEKIDLYEEQIEKQVENLLNSINNDSKTKLVKVIEVDENKNTYLMEYYKING